MLKTAALLLCVSSVRETPSEKMSSLELAGKDAAQFQGSQVGYSAFKDGTKEGLRSEEGAGIQ